MTVFFIVAAAWLVLIFAARWFVKYLGHGFGA